MTAMSVMRALMPAIYVMTAMSAMTALPVGGGAGVRQQGSGGGVPGHPPQVSPGIEYWSTRVPRLMEY